MDFHSSRFTLNQANILCCWFRRKKNKSLFNKIRDFTLESNTESVELELTRTTPLKYRYRRDTVINSNYQVSYSETAFLDGNVSSLYKAAAILFETENNVIYLETNKKDRLSDIDLEFTLFKIEGNKLKETAIIVENDNEYFYSSKIPVTKGKYALMVRKQHLQTKQIFLSILSNNQITNISENTVKLKKNAVEAFIPLGCSGEFSGKIYNSHRILINSEQEETIFLENQSSNQFSVFLLEFKTKSNLSILINNLTLNLGYNQITQFKAKKDYSYLILSFKEADCSNSTVNQFSSEISLKIHTDQAERVIKTIRPKETVLFFTDYALNKKDSKFSAFLRLTETTETEVKLHCTDTPFRLIFKGNTIEMKKGHSLQLTCTELKLN